MQRLHRVSCNRHLRILVSRGQARVHHRRVPVDRDHRNRPCVRSARAAEAVLKSGDTQWARGRYWGRHRIPIPTTACIRPFPAPIPNQSRCRSSMLRTGKAYSPTGSRTPTRSRKQAYTSTRRFRRDRSQHSPPRKLRFLAILILLSGFVNHVCAQDENIDSVAFQKIQKTKLSDSHIPQIAFNLTDAAGARLTNSPGFFRAGNWAVETMKEWGLVNAALEPWGNYAGDGS